MSELQTALFYRVGEWRGRRCCFRPGCDRLFVPSNKRQWYCGFRCADLDDDQQQDRRAS